MNLLRRPRRWWSGLALAASLLLSLLPTAGRWHEAFVPEARAEAVLAMCTAQGLVYRQAPAVDGWRDADPSAPDDRGQPAGQTGDCAYCPLLASLALHVPSTAAWSPPASPDGVPSPASVDPAFREPRSGLGPRGPPSAQLAG